MSLHKKKENQTKWHLKKKILFKQSIPHTHTQTKEDDKTIVKTRRL